VLHCGTTDEEEKKMMTVFCLTECRYDYRIGNNTSRYEYSSRLLSVATEVRR